jgi:hypothetical protein
MQRKQKYMLIFTIIVFVWAIGMGALILWQTGRGPTQPEESEASYTTPDVPNSEQGSRFGKLLN